MKTAYWPAHTRLKRLGVASKHPLDAEAADYFRTLEVEAGLVIDYRRVSAKG